MVTAPEFVITQPTLPQVRKVTAKQSNSDIAVHFRPGSCAQTCGRVSSYLNLTFVQASALGYNPQKQTENEKEMTE
jgi:hypothetical protein